VSCEKVCVDGTLPCRTQVADTDIQRRYGVELASYHFATYDEQSDAPLITAKGMLEKVLNVSDSW
jgi:hypothetical protein